MLIALWNYAKTNGLLTEAYVSDCFDKKQCIAVATTGFTGVTLLLVFAKSVCRF